jgi:hypothetical protein
MNYLLLFFLASAPLDLSEVGSEIALWLLAGAGSALVFFAGLWGLKISIEAFGEATERRHLEDARRSGDNEYVESAERAQSLRDSRRND